jgi:hypothetical protein
VIPLVAQCGTRDASCETDSAETLPLRDEGHRPEPRRLAVHNLTLASGSDIFMMCVPRVGLEPTLRGV